ncbi:MAG: hypothetical protein FWC82_03730 [Firmicutes bacterium]|nr:hypothetical protein [Bacillota bacterium]
MEKYKINFATETVTISQDFAKKANVITTEEYEFLRKLTTDYPNMKVIYKKHRSPKKSNSNKGLTYDNMRRYMNTFDNSDELTEMFLKVIEKSAPQKNKYQYIKKWFLAQFPNYREIPPYDSPSQIIRLIPLEDIPELNTAA